MLLHRHYGDRLRKNRGREPKHREQLVQRLPPTSTSVRHSTRTPRTMTRNFLNLFDRKIFPHSRDISEPQWRRNTFSVFYLNTRQFADSLKVPIQMFLFHGSKKIIMKKKGLSRNVVLWDVFFQIFQKHIPLSETKENFACYPIKKARKIFPIPRLKKYHTSKRAGWIISGSCKKRHQRLPRTQ